MERLQNELIDRLQWDESHGRPLNGLGDSFSVAEATSRLLPWPAQSEIRDEGPARRIELRERIGFKRAAVAVACQLAFMMHAVLKDR
ncbi:hypothetical protein LMTR13_25210 [Bradyrhizobium icense]|uniref:Uncharacterized protein n=1 Tax=Bradyrhizobium icense TaxID=1274631 RepID=A0A1B1UJK3_9BRAD|nr:hypothetical protein LMTR13_25210 [Bradyrhizobium icense]